MAEADHNSSQPAAPEVAKPRKTRGERLFDWLVYGGLNGVGTFLLTIPLAYWGDYGKGSKFFEKCERYLIKNFHVGAKSAEQIVGTTTLGLGGTVMVIPVRIAERFRTPMVNWLNHEHGDAADKSETLKETPPQTWGSLLKGRVFAWLAVFSSLKGFEYATAAAGKPDMLRDFKHWFSETLICNPLGKVTHTISAAKVAELKALGTEEAKALVKAAETKAYRYGKLAALDVFATTAATILLYTGSRFFARQRAEHQAQVATTTGQGGHAQFEAAEGDVTTAQAMPGNAPEYVVAGEKLHAGALAAREAAQGIAT